MKFEFKGVVIPTDEWFVVLDGDYPEGTLIGWSDIFTVVARNFPCSNRVVMSVHIDANGTKTESAKLPSTELKLMLNLKE